MFGGRITEDGHNRNVGISINNLVHESMSIFQEGNENEDIPAFYKTFDFIDISNIYFCGTLDFIYFPDNYFYHNIDNYFFIDLLNENLNLKWQKYYGGDAYYTLYNSLATDDGGFIVLGTVYDENKAENYRDIYLLKVDSLGNYIPATIPENPVTNNYNIYPNPGNDYFNLDLSSQQYPVELKVYDISGKLLSSETIENNYQRIHTSDLKSGLYFIRITDNNKLEKTVKWVKQ